MSRVKEERVPLVEVKDSVKDFPGVMALDKVSFALYAGEIHVLVGGKMHEDAQKLLDMLATNIDTKVIVQDLNVAEQQMVEVAKALSMESQVIIMDEPTAALSAQEVDKLFEIIKQLCQQGIGIIYISHRLEEITRVGDRITVLRDGQYVGTLPAKGVNIDTLLQMMVDRQITSKFPWEKRDIGDIVLQVDQLSQSGSFQDVSFAL